MMDATVSTGSLIVTLTACLWLSGCGSESPPMLAEQSSEAAHDHAAGDHDHPTEGPHGGHLIELGNEEYHAELLHDDKTDTVTIHLLDGPAEQPVAVSESEVTIQLFREGQFIKYVLKAVSGSAGAEGSSSRFEIVDADLCEILCDEEHLRGRLQVTIDGKLYSGVIEHASHEHGEHECGEHEHGDHEDHDHEDHEDHDH